MFIRAAAPAGTSLIYLVTTTPSPLEITPADTTPTPAKISITAANPGADPVRVTSIKFTLVGGAGAGALTEHLDRIDTTVSPAADWTFTNGNDGTFTATPTSDSGYVDVTDKGLLLELTGIAVNGELGVTTLDVLERTRDEDGDTVKGTAEFDLGKCLPGFRFSDLLPTFLDDGRTTLANGDTVTLTWTASHGATYTMLHENTSYDVTNVRTWTTPAPLHRDATFHLRAGLTTDGHTVTHYLHTSVTVDKPDLALGTVTVDGLLTANGDIDAVGSDAIVRIRELRGPSGVELQINSHTHILTDNNGLTVTGPVDIAGNLTASGSGAFGSDLSTTGGLAVDDAATLNGGLQVTGDFTAKQGDNICLTTVNRTSDVLFPDGFSAKGICGFYADVHVDDAALTVGGENVICNNDSIGLQNFHYSGWLYASSLITDNRRETSVWVPGNRVNSDSWKVVQVPTGG
ncbi:hypothetical protein [Kitasatospora sp. NPDC056184]|uniref:hypothetical protein n=1 Tax=Kitasatospora sp. NPDC056184 TaxID=3345738 RepID=UPI0035E393E5